MEGAATSTPYKSSSFIVWLHVNWGLIMSILLTTVLIHFIHDLL